MSPKELTYIEDALNHEQFLKNQCENAASMITDQQIFQQFYDLI